MRGADMNPCGQCIEVGSRWIVPGDREAVEVVGIIQPDRHDLRNGEIARLRTGPRLLCRIEAITGRPVRHRVANGQSYVDVLCLGSPSDEGEGPLVLHVGTASSRLRLRRASFFLGAGSALE